MKTEDILSRRLDPVGCKIVGARVKAHILSLKEKEKADGVNLPDKLIKAIDDFLATVDSLASALPDEVVVRVVDTGADQAFGGFRSLIEGIVDTFHPVDYLPISSEDLARGENARKLLALTFPNGSAFLKAKYDTQWTEMDKLVRVLESDAAKPLVAALGLTAEVKRLIQWSALYGEKRNITTEEDTSTKKIQGIVERWHKSYAKLLTQALSFYDDDDNELHMEKRAAFVAAYSEQLDKIREEERARREEKKAEKKG